MTLGPIKQTLKKEERLHSKKLISELFKTGESFFVYPFRVLFLEVGIKDQYPLQLLISVSKRNYKKAVDRNKIKRLIRESYRKNKTALVQSRSTRDNQLLIGLIYTGKTILPYPEIERKIILILQHLIEQNKQTTG